MSSWLSSSDCEVDQIARKGMLNAMTATTPAYPLMAAASKRGMITCITGTAAIARAAAQNTVTEPMPMMVWL